MVGIGDSMKSPLSPESKKIAQFTFRSDGVKVNYSPTIVKDNSGVFALKTDLEITVKLWSKGETEESKPLLNVKGLRFAKELKLDWR